MSKAGRVVGVMVAAAMSLWAPGVVRAAGWELAAFDGQQVVLIVVHPQRANEMAVVVNGGVLELSHDRGMTWDDSSLDVPVRSVSYDPTYIGYIYAGTDNGLYISEDNGMSWRLLESQQTGRKLVSAVFADTNYVFAAMGDGAGTAVRVLRFKRDGVFVDTNLPSGIASSFDYDYAHHRLYVGAAGGVYSSDDEGITWSGDGSGAGQFTQHVVVKSDAIWQVSAQGLFRSGDEGSSWNKLAAPGDLNETSYGNDMNLTGLAVNHGRAFYGDWSYSYPYKFLAEYDGGAAHSILNARVYDVADGGDRLWVATANGLMVDNDISSTEAAIRRPVVIVPGILGSLPTSIGLAHYFENAINGHWGDSYETPMVLDPIEHTYDGLISSLLKRGYQLNRTLFLFPYDWTQDNATTARELGQKIYDIRQVCDCSQVDVVAHSMGGLVARSYIQSNDYGNDVRNLIQLATPNAGAAAAYAMWEGGTDPDIQPDFDNQLLDMVVRALEVSDAAPERAEAVRRHLPSVGQLLPIFDYLDGRRYPDGYPRNPFLEQLDQPMEVSTLRQRVSLYLVGSQSLPTLNSLIVGQPHRDAAAWPDGSILGSDTAVGDGTVPAMSLEAIASADAWFATDHTGIVSAAASYIARILMGGYLDDDEAAAPPLAIQPHTVVETQGPVALSLTDATGRTVDDQAIGIPGAYYSGSGVSPQLMSVPENEAGTYSVTVTGTGTGVYQLSTAELSDKPTSTYDDSTIATGSIAVGKRISYTYDPIAQTLVSVAITDQIMTASSFLSPLVTGIRPSLVGQQGSVDPDPSLGFGSVSASLPSVLSSTRPLEVKGLHLLPPTFHATICPLAVLLVASVIILAWRLKRLRL